MKIVVGIPCRYQGRWSGFWQCVENLDRGTHDVRVVSDYDNSVARARNVITQKALDWGADAIFWLDDDLVFEADTLLRILQRPESIVIGLTMLRARLPMKDSHGTAHGTAYRPIWSDVPIYREASSGDVIWTPVRDVEVGPNGLKKLLSGSGGGVLTRTDIFAKIPHPWWQQGQIVPDMFWEDIFFYHQATQAGIEIWGDPSIRFGHTDAVTIWPHCDDATGKWTTLLATGTNVFAGIPWDMPVREVTVK